MVIIHVKQIYRCAQQTEISGSCQRFMVSNQTSTFTNDFSLFFKFLLVSDALPALRGWGAAAVVCPLVYDSREPGAVRPAADYIVWSRRQQSSVVLSAPPAMVETVDAHGMSHKGFERVKKEEEKNDPACSNFNDFLWTVYRHGR